MVKSFQILNTNETSINTKHLLGGAHTHTIDLKEILEFEVKYENEFSDFKYFIKTDSPIALSK